MQPLITPPLEVRTFRDINRDLVFYMCKPGPGLLFNGFFVLTYLYVVQSRKIFLVVLSGGVSCRPEGQGKGPVVLEA